MLKKTAAILLCAVILVNLCSCADTGEETLNITAMNTLIQIRVFGNSAEKNNSAISLFKEEIEKEEQLFDTNLPESDAALINACESGCEVEDLTAELLKKAIDAAEFTDGAFDITVMPVLKLWGFDNGNYRVPKDGEINTALKKTGREKIALDGNSVKKEKGVEVSFGGIAKGFLGDKLLQIAEENDIAAIVSLGGNIVLCGNNGDKYCWRVGVKNPVDTQGIACSFECDGGFSVVTSGAYERYFEKDGKVYHHIIDTKTGKPAQSDLLSVTVVGKDGALCDALSTALFASGSEKSVAFAKENSGFEYIFITDKNEIIVSEGIKNAKTESDGYKLTVISSLK